jgi:uncharacterized protein YbjT (DUF2867 family)
MKNKIFVSGATGFQGNSIAQLALQKGQKVVSLSASKKEDEQLGDLQIIAGSLADKKAIGRALQNVNKAVFALPLLFDRETAIQFATNFIEIAEEKEVELVVFNTGFDLPQSKTGLTAIDLKLDVANLFKASSLKVITLMPDIYLDNLVAPWSLPLITEQGILPYPVKNGQKIPWISHTDLAKYSIAALDHPQLAGQTLPIGGHLVAGEEIANHISKKLNKKINYIGSTPDEFEKQLIPSFGELAAKEISNLYRYVRDHSNHLNSKKFAQTKNLLAVSPQTLEEWVEEIHFN